MRASYGRYGGSRAGCCGSSSCVVVGLSGFLLQGTGSRVVGVRQTPALKIANEDRRGARLNANEIEKLSIKLPLYPHR